jgi:O-antigen ligase
VGAAGVGTLELSSRLRTAALPPATQLHDLAIEGHQVYVPGSLSAIGDTVSADTRPKLWAFYIGEAERHAWVGVGFGKPLPGIVYRSEMPASLLAVEPQALTHAHNLFINTWLQTGFIGVVLQTVLLLCLVARFWRLRRVKPWLCAAGIALVAGMIAKNTTDDFMWQTTMLAFWAFAGLLLGCAEQARAPGGTSTETARGQSTLARSEQRREAPTAELGE